MANKPVENLVYEFLTAHTAEFVGDADPVEFEIMSTPYDRRTQDTGIEIGDADTSMLPNGNGENVTEFDGLLTLEIYSRVVDTDKDDRAEARQKAFDIKKTMLQLFETHPTLQGRTCRVRVMRQVRFFDDIKGDKWAIERVPIVLDPRDLRGD